MCSGRTAFTLFSALLATAIQSWAASFPKSIIPAASETTARRAGGERTYGRIVRKALTADELAAPMNFDIALILRNREELEARVNRGEVLSRAALEPYLPTADDYAKVRAWLLAQGFEITMDADSRHAIFARGSNTQIVAAFGVQLARVATADGEFTSAVTAPSVPDEIAGAVGGIRGLQQHLIRHPRSLKGQQLMATGYAAITPAAVTAVYQVPASLNGFGQTIAIIGDSIPSISDLIEFWSLCGIPQAPGNFSVATVQGGPGSATMDAFEMAMDVEWASGMAPAAKIRLYALPYPMDSNGEAAAYTQILNDLPSNPTIHQVTESFGSFEPPSVQDGDSALILLVAQGVTCFASSDDGGSNPDSNTGAYNAAAPLSVSYPASDPSMTAVGGTTLFFLKSNDGQYSPPEVAWSLTTDQGVTAATGGGISSIFSRPSWQVATGVPAGTQRCVPDVSALAYTGGASNDMGSLVYQGGVYIGSGTSLSSPIWAGLCALINQSRAGASLTPVGFLNPKLYAAAGTSCFTDITSGNNGAYNAGPGYDLCTGLGSPLVNNLITYLSTINQPPYIYNQPASVPVLFNQSAQFSVTVGGYPGPSYQWQVSMDGGVSWTNLAETAPYSGTTTATLTITAATATINGDLYRCLATNASGSVTSNAATLTVNGLTVFTTQPMSQTVLTGSATILTATATSKWGTPTYQWQISADGGATWTNLIDTALYSGTTTGQLTITGVTAAMNGYQYQCLAWTSIEGSVASNAAILTITSAAGSLWGMGDNGNGELGVGTTQVLTPEMILPGGVQAVATGEAFSLIVKTDGSLWAMGANSVGQLGDGTTTQRNTPVQVPLPGGVGVQAVAAGDSFSLILGTDRSLWATGGNNYGQLGDGTTNERNSPEQILPSEVQAVAAGSDFSLIVKTDGSLWAMGGNNYGQLGDGTTYYRWVPEQIFSGGVQAVAAGQFHTLILKLDGSLWATGDNDNGQLGDGTTTRQNTPEMILPGGVQAVAAGGQFSLIVKTDGSLWAMGGNNYGQLGDGTTYYRWVPEQIFSGGVQAVSAGFDYSLIVKTDGSLWATGDNGNGVFGDGTTTSRSTPELIAMNVQRVAAGSGSLVVASGATGLAPVVTTQPTRQSVIASGNASFTVELAGNQATTYQWQLSTDGWNTWVNLTDMVPYIGTATATLTITGAIAGMNGYEYRCVVSDSTGSATTISATLTVYTAPAFTIQPTGQTVAVGGMTTFTVSVSGNPLPTYQWQLSTDSGDTWTNLAETAPYSGTATPTLTITGATMAMNGYQYECLASNSVQNNVASNAAVLTALAGATVGVPSNVIPTGFSAAWSRVSGATGYRLDVSTNSSFSSFVTGYQNLDVGNVTSEVVNGLDPNTTYYYRVRAYDSAGTGPNSSTIIVTTSATIVVTTPLTVSTLAGQPLSSGALDGAGNAARFYYPSGVAADNAGNLYLADTDNDTIRKIVVSTGTVTTLAGQAGISGNTDATGSAARFNMPSGVAVDAADNIYVADTLNNTLRKITASGVVSTLAGSPGVSGNVDGTGSAASFQGPQGLAIDIGGNLYVADTNNQTIRKVVVATGVVTTVAGVAGNPGSADGLGSAARFNNPSGVAVDASGNLYVADTENHTIRQILPSGMATTLAGLAGYSGGADGTGSAARFNSPSDLAVDSSGNVYVADTDNFTVRKVIPSSGTVTTLAGLAETSGSADGVGSAVRFFHPAGIAIDSNSNLYVADTDNQTVRVGLLAIAPVIQTQPQSQTVTAGSSAQFSVTASGRPAVTYQWNFNGAAISGATSNTYSLSNVQASNAGNYTVVVSNVMGTVTSNTASLTVSQSTPTTTIPQGGGDSGGGGGGGGAPSAWFCGALLLLAAARKRLRQTMD
jgi:alpha-tubulin suppressor-like RCC1 family protein/sugar lactone lactonase YvrE